MMKLLKGLVMPEIIPTFRGSGAPLNMACPASAWPEPDEVLLDTLIPAGMVGTVGHKLAEPIVLTGRIPENWQEVCKAYGLDEAQTQDASSLMWAAKTFWDVHGPAFENPRVEVPVSYTFENNSKPFRMSTHQDVLSLIGPNDAPGSAIVGDWKSTRLDIDYSAQLLSYALVLISNYPSLEKVTTAIIFLRDRTANIQEWSKPVIEDFKERFIQRVVNWDGRIYTSGAHCGYCRRFAQCPGIKELNQGSIEQLGLVPLQAEYLPVSPVTVDMYQRVKALSAVIDRFKEMVRATVEQAGGELVGGSGQRLVLVPQSRDNINAALAWPVISPVLSQEELATCTSIKKKEMLDAIATHAPRGQKGKSKTTIMEELVAAGAITKTEFTALRVMQPKEESKEIEIGN
jgi:hypothetical protein